MAENGGRGGRGFKSHLSRAEMLLGLAENAGKQREETLKELHEQEIFWGDKEAEQNGFQSDLFGIGESRCKNCKGKSTWRNIFPHGGKRMGESAPVNVPNWPPTKICESFQDEEGEMVVRPPHEFIAHYDKNKDRSFPVVEGFGRTLKGRDLRKLRDTVFRQTGFVD